MKAKPPRRWRMPAVSGMLQPALQAVAMLLIVAAVISLNACVTPYSTSPLPPGGSGAIEQTSVDANEPGYFISPEDLLFISVWQEPELQREVRVRPDGGISFPLAGNVDVAGKTVEMVTDIITERVQKYIPAAVVTVSVQEVAGYSIFVIGQVNEPGQFTLGRYVDVIQALTLAGGLTPFANGDAITIRRRTPNGEIVMPFDYGAVRAGRNMEQNVILQSGDTVVVP